MFVYGIPFAVWVLSSCLCAAVSLKLLTLDKHGKSMFFMGMGLPYLGALAVHFGSGCWLFFSSLSAGAFAPTDAAVIAFGMGSLSAALLGVAFA
jgi:hypothetical protein